MFVAFLMQGYGPISIGLLTLHSLLAYRFIWRFIKQWRPDKRLVSTWFGAAALFFFVLSSLGPFAIPAIQILGEGNSLWLKMAVHYYLHFQYNGWFLFGAFALLFKIMEKKQTGLPFHWARWQFGLMALALFPAYFVTLSASSLPGWTAHLATLGVWLQWAGYFLFVYHFVSRGVIYKLAQTNASRFLLAFALVMIFVKFTFEVIGATPPFSNFFAPFSHFLIIGYLHLIFLGAVTPLLWWINAELGYFSFRQSWVTFAMAMYIPGFVGSETALMLLGLKLPLPQTTLWLFLFSVLLFLGTCAMLIVILRREKIDSLMTEPNTSVTNLQPEFSK
ncbi:MAG: hypothetical protein ACE5FF_07315 [Saprospiraceae bacterium]